MAVIVVDAGGAPLYRLELENRIVTLNANGEVQPVDVASLRQILSRVIGRVRMVRTTSGAGKIVWREEGECFPFPRNEALIAREPTESVLQRLLERELLPLVPVLAQ